MAANNDFFLNFGSNAKTWGAQLERDLAGARAAITGVQALLDNLNASATTAGSATQQALAKSIPTVTGGGGKAFNGGELLTNINLASDELKHLVTGLRSVVDGLKGLPKQVADVATRTPAKDAQPGLVQQVGNTMRGVSTTVQNIERLQRGQGSSIVPGAAGFVKAGTPGSVATGSLEHAIGRQVANAVKSGLSLSGGAISGAFVPRFDRPSIATVSRSSIDKAGVDRIVTAIRAQTRVIESRLRGGISTVGAPVNTVSPTERAPSVGATSSRPSTTSTAIETEEQKLLARLERRKAAQREFENEVAAKIAQLAEVAGPEAEAAITALQTQLRESHAKAAAETARMERDLTGITQAQQKVARRTEAAAARDAIPTITDRERDRRLLAQQHVSAVGNPAFLESIGRGQGKLSKADLREMAESLKMAGFDPQIRARASAQEMGKALQKAGADLKRQFADVIPDGLRTDGYNVSRTTQIGPELKSLLGDLNAGAALARERETMRELIRSNIASGGDLKDPIAGRRGFGASVYDGPMPLVRSGTPAEVREAYELMRTSPNQEMELARRNARSASFDPYDPALSRAIKPGNTPEERLQAEGARLLLRGLRASTKELDRMGQAFLTLEGKLRDNKNFIERTEAALMAGEGGKKEERALRDARAQNEKIMRAMSTLGQEGRADIFRDPNYQAGLLRREGTGSRLPEGAEGPLTSRQAYEQRVQQMQMRGQASLWGDMMRASGEAIAGLRTAIGRRELIGNIPGMTVDRRGYIGSREGLSSENAQLLRRDQLHLASAQDRVFSGRDTSPEARAKLENAANRFANTIHDLFDGLSPTIRSLTGQDPQIETNVQAEARRDEVREAARQRALQKFTPKTPQEQLPEAEAALVSMQQQRVDAAKRAAEAAAKHAIALERHNSQEAKLLKGVTDAEREEYRALQKTADAADLRAEKATNRLAQFPKGDIKHILSEGGIGPRTEADTRLQELKAINRTAQEDASHARHRMNEIIQLDPSIEQDYRDTGRAVRAAAEEERGLEAATRRWIETTKKLRSEIAQVTALAGSGALTREGKKITRKDIAEAMSEQFGRPLAESQRRVKEILGPARAPAGTTTEAARVESAVADMNGQLAALRAERKTLQAQPHTRTQVKELEARALAAEAAVSGRRGAALQGQVTRATNAGDAERVAVAQANLDARRKEAAAARAAADQAKATAARLAEIRKALAGTGGGSGGGDAAPPTASGAAGGRGRGDDNILQRILAKLGEIHATIKGGVKVTGRAEPETATPRTKTPDPRLAAAGNDPAAIEQARREIAQERALARLGGADDPKRKAAVNAAHEQALNEIAEAEAKRARATNKSYLEQVRLTAATNLLSQATRLEVAELRRLTAAGADESQINAQRLKTYTAMDADLRGQGIGAQGRHDAARAVLGDIDPRVTGGVVQELSRTARAVNGFQTVDSAMARGVPTDGLFGGNSEFTRAMFGNAGFWSRVMHSTGTFVVRNFTAGFVFGMTAALQQVVEQAIQAEATFVRVSAALEATGKDTGNIRSDLQGIASEYGVQLNDVYTQAAGLAGLFDNAESLAAGTRIAAQLQIISGGAVNAQEAIGILASTLSAFQAMPGEDVSEKLLPGGLEGVTKVADVLTSIQNNLGTNVEITAEGVSRMSGLARQMELSFEQTAVFTAQIAKQTNLTGAGAGEQFSRILAGIQTGRGRAAAAEAFGPGIEQELGAGDYGAAIERMIGGWDGLTDAQRRNLTVAIAGSRQAASFNALMNNGTRTLNALRKAEDANGDAARRMSELVKTLNNQLARLGTNIQVLVSNLIQTGILDFLGLLLFVTNNVLEAINGILNAFNGLAESNGFLTFLRDTIGLLLGAGLAMKVTQAGITGMRGAIAAAAATNTGAAYLGATSEIVQRRRGLDPNGDYADPRQRGGFLTREARVIQINADRVDSSFLNKKGVAAPSGGVVGRSSGFLAGSFADFSNRMLNAVEERAARAEAYRSRYGDQVRYSALSGGEDDTLRRAFRENLAEQGLSANEVTRRTKAPDSNLLRAANSLDRINTAGTGAARGAAKAASALEGLGGAGLGADLALAAVLAGVVAFVGGINQQAHDAKIAAEALKDFQLNPQEQREQADEQARYIGKATEDLNQQREDLMKGGISGAWNRTWGTLQARLTNGLSGFVNPALALEKQYGLEDVPLDSSGGFDFKAALEREGNITGMDEANQYVESTRKAMQELIKKPGATVEELRRLEQSSLKDLDLMAYQVEKDASLTEGEKKAKAAALESARAQTADMVLQYSAMVDDLAGTVVLTASQLAEVQELANLSIQTGGQSVIGGLDVSGILGQLASDTGVEGTGIGNALDKMSSGGTDVIDRAQINLKILRESVTRLYASWRSKLEVDPLGDETIAVRSQLISAIGQLQQASDQVIQSMYDNAALLGGQAATRGNLPQAIGYYIDALHQADREYDRQTRAIEKSFEAQEALAKTVYVNQGRLRELIGQQTSLAGLMGGEGGVDSTALLLGGPLALSGGELPEVPAGIEYDPNSFILSGYAPPVPDEAEKKKGERERRAKYDQGASATFQALTELLIFQATRHITLQIAQTADAGLRAGLEAQRANIEASIYAGLRSGDTADLPGISSLTPRQADRLDTLADEYGDLGVSLEQLHGSQVSAAQAQVASAQAQEQAAEEARAEAAEARQQRAALIQARLGVAAAWADARGDAVAAAQVQRQIAAATMAAAKADLAAAVTTSEVMSARIAILNAQAQIIAANAAVQQSQAALIQSQFDVSIALAEAAGNTVLTAQRQLAAARAALGAALKRSNGKATAEVNAARAEAIRAEAALRDARLQDQLDTINFNLEMGKMTASSAIAALREILRTQDLTKQQRRQLLLQIKGMKDEMADSQWNFGDIKLPTPYQMRRYIEQRKKDFKGQLDGAAARSAQSDARSGVGGGGMSNSNNTVTNQTEVNIQIDGADIAKVKKIIREVVGGNVKTRTTGARRR